MSKNKFAGVVWGIERTATTLWVGPLRLDGSGKIAALVTAFDIEGLTPSALAEAEERALLVSKIPELVCNAVATFSYFDKKHDGCVDPLWHSSRALLEEIKP